MCRFERMYIHIMNVAGIIVKSGSGVMCVDYMGSAHLHFRIGTVLMNLTNFRLNQIDGPIYIHRA